MDDLLVQEADAAPDPPEAAGTGEERPEQAPPQAELKPEAARRIARLAGSRGGKRMKPVPPVTGLGASTPSTITAATLGTLDGRLGLLMAVAEALTLGRCSSATATALVAVVKAAAEDVRQDQGAQLERLARRVEELTAGRTITVR